MLDRFKGKRPLLLLFLVLAVLLAHSSSLKNDFIWVDKFQIQDEFLIIHNLNEFGRAFTSQFYSGEAVSIQKGYYRPLVEISYTLDFIIWKKNPFGYHLTNITLHILNTLLVYGIALLLSRANRAAMISALIFGLHPLQVSAVGIIADRAGLLSGSFLLLSFCLYLKGHNKPALFSFIPALLAKEVAVVLPLLILLYEYIFSAQGRMRLLKAKSRVIASFFGILVAYLIWRLLFVGNIGFGIAPFWGRPYRVILTMFVVMADYLRLCILPINLSVSDSFRLYSSFRQPAVWGAFLFLAVIGITLYRFRAKRKLLFSAAWFFTLLIPVSNIISSAHFRAERFLYLPLAGLAFIFGVWASRLIEKRRAAAVVLLALCLWLAGATFLRNRFFSDDYTLFSKTVKENPHCFEARAILGNYYLEKNEYKEAIRQYEAIIHSGDDYIGYNNLFEVHNNLGVAYDSAGLCSEAIEQYLAAIKIKPDSPDAYHNLGLVYERLGRVAEAKKAFEQARKFDIIPGQ